MTLGDVFRQRVAQSAWPVPPFHADRLDARDPALIASILPHARILCRRYFRLHVEGEEHIRPGPTMYVGNHNNGIAGPESLCTLSTLWAAHGPEAGLYALAHDFPMRHFTPLGRVLQRFGGIRASRHNGRQVLRAGASLLVYPGGDLEAYRHTRRRDEIILGERLGFVHLAREMSAPIVPVVAQGAHRSALIFSEGETLARRIGLKHWARLERFPLALSVPWGLTVGPWLPYLPLPFPIRLRFLPSIHVRQGEDITAVRDRIRSTMQSALDGMAGRSRAVAS